jgi:FlaA1/EpsC-like NDP-sugar epimerase
MTAVDWALLVAVIVYICLLAVALRYPRVREHWKRDKRETLQILLSATVFLMLFFLLWYVSASVDWPDAVTVTVWVCAFCFVGLLLVGIFAPHGIRLRFEKKGDTVTADEDEY